MSFVCLVFLFRGLNGLGFTLFLFFSRGLGKSFRVSVQGSVFGGLGVGKSDR